MSRHSGCHPPTRSRQCGGSRSIGPSERIGRGSCRPCSRSEGPRSSDDAEGLSGGVGRSMLALYIRHGARLCQGGSPRGIARGISLPGQQAFLRNATRGNSGAGVRGKNGVFTRYRRDAPFRTLRR
jgi:hypothetical protein